MRLLRRYLLRQLTAPFLYGLGALTSMLLMNQIAKRLGDLVGKGLEWSVIAEVLLLSLPFIIALTLPMAVLVAVLYAFTHLTADNEITAMRASGISVAQILRPVFVAGALTALVAFFFVDQVLPRSNARLRNLQLDIGRKKPTFTLKEQAINHMAPSLYFLRAAKIEAVTGRLTEVTIYDLGPAAVRRVITADSGFMGFDEGQRDLTLRLFHGTVREYKPFELTTAQVTYFRQNTVMVRDVENSLERGSTNLERGDREMSTCEMLDEVTRARYAAEDANRTRADLTRADLRTILRLGLAEAPETRRTRRPPPSCDDWWRSFEAWFGKYVLPERAEAQDAGVQDVIIQDSLPELPAGDSPAGPAGPQSPSVALTPVSDVTIARDTWYQEVRKAASFGVEVHKKSAIAVACLNFVLIGIALALRFPRGGMGLVLGGSLSIFAIFYVGLTAGESLADRGLIGPGVAMWMPNILIAIVGVWGLLKVNRESGSTRGGDLAEIAETLRNFFGRRRTSA